MYHTLSRSGIARINSDGSLDEDYNIGIGFDDSVYSLRLQPDGKVLVGGIFTSFNTTRRMGLARVFTSGSLDTSFMDTAYNQFAGLPKTFSFDNPSFINAIDLQTNGDLMIGGSFTNVGGNLSVNYPFEVSTSGSISGRTNGHNSGAHPSAPFTRQDKTTRFNVARIIGGYTLGPGNLEYDPASLPFSIDENSGDLSVTLRRVDGRLGTAQVLPSTTNNTAVFPLDFSSSTSTQTWAESTATINAVFVLSPVSVGFVGNTYFTVPISDDTLQEGDETFGLVVSNAFGGITLGGEFIPLGAALGHADKASASIADNDFNKGIFNFEFAGYLVNENGAAAVISVIRTNGSAGTVTVDYRTRNGTATNGGDYTSVSGTLRFVTGQTNATFTVPILNGPEVEFDETVNLILTNATGGAKLPGGLANSTVTTTLTIIDDDFLSGRLQFTASAYTNNENEVSAVITVTRTGGNLGVLSAQFTTLPGGTATAGADYATTNGILLWADGESGPKSFTVPLISDGVVEGDESVLLRLSNPSQAGALGARTNAMLWIRDGDSYGAISFNQSFYEADENGSTPTLTVVRSGGSAGTVSVAFATSPLIAISGVDYFDTNGVLTFLPGEFSKT
ncbi:MAG TPA: Calx-beta domain-containing protein, partial [Verrucomicrobiae bacterium]